MLYSCNRILSQILRFRVTYTFLFKVSPWISLLCFEHRWTWERKFRKIGPSSKRDDDPRPFSIPTWFEKTVNLFIRYYYDPYLLILTRLFFKFFLDLFSQLKYFFKYFNLYKMCIYTRLKNNLYFSFSNYQFPWYSTNNTRTRCFREIITCVNFRISGALRQV